MSKQIVIATHALLAKGFQESLNFIFKPEDPIHTICAFTEVSDPGKAFEELFDTFSEEDTVVVLTDLVGGSVNNLIAERLQGRDFYLISGINLAVLLEIACVPEENLNEDFIRKTLEQGKKGIVFINDKLANSAKVGRHIQ
jgi:mannose/fructose-specific phosphotransferase system component IIA